MSEKRQKEKQKKKGSDTSEHMQHGENENMWEKHESDLTKKERRLMEKQKLSGMGFKKKLEYIWMYYKPAIFGVIGFILLICLGVDIYHNAQKVTILSLSVVNAGNVDSEARAQEIKEQLGAEGKYEQVDVASNLITNPEGDSFDYYTQMAYVTQLQTQALDILVMPETLYENLSKDQSEVFADLKEVLGEEAYASFGEDIDEHHLSLDSTGLSEDFDLKYEPVCIAVLVNSKHLETAGEWIATLAE